MVLPSPLAPERCLGHIKAVLDRCGAEYAAAHALMAEKHVGLVVALAAQVGQGKVGAAAGGHGWPPR